MSSYNFFSNQNTLHYGESATVIVEGWSEVKPWAQTNNSDRLNMTLVLPLTSRAVWLKSRARYPINYRHVNYYSFSSPACFIHVRVWNIISLMNHSLPGPRALPRAISASWSFEKSMACIFIVYTCRWNRVFRVIEGRYKCKFGFIIWLLFLHEFRESFIDMETSSFKQ